MKYIVLILFFPLFCFSQNKNVNVSCTYSENSKANAVLCQITDFFASYVVIDSTNSHNDTYKFSKSIIGDSNLYAIYFNDEENIVYFIPSAENIFIEYNSGVVKENNDKPMKVNTNINEFSKFYFKLYYKRKEVNAKYIKTNEFTEKLDLKNRLDSIDKAKAQYIENFIKSNYDNISSVIALFLCMQEINQNEELYISSFKSLAEPVKNSYYGRKVGKIVNNFENVKIGKPIIEFELPDTNGVMTKISSLKGKYFLIDFWASYCGPCIGELPYLKDAIKKYKQFGFDIVGISIDNNKLPWLNAIKNYNLRWTQLIWNFNPPKGKEGIESDVAKAYAVLIIPTNFLIDPQGKIIAKNLRRKDLDIKLSEIFKLPRK